MFATVVLQCHDDDDRDLHNVVHDLLCFFSVQGMPMPRIHVSCDDAPIMTTQGDDTRSKRVIALAEPVNTSRPYGMGVQLWRQRG